MAFKFILISSLLLAAASAGIIQHQHQQPVTYAHVAAQPAASHAVASSHQNVVRTFDGTVSEYSKTIEAPYASVHKYDTRVSNNAYKPAADKTVTYAAPAPAPAAVYTHSYAPAVQKTVSYAAPAPAKKAVVYTHSAPVAYVAPTVSKTSLSSDLYTHATPATSKTVYYVPNQHSHAVVAAAPTVTKSVTYGAVAAPAPVYHKHEVQVPVTTTKHVTYSAPAPIYDHSAHHAVHSAHSVHSAPAVATTSYNHGHSAPAVAITSYNHGHSAPAVATTTYNHGPAASTYTHNAPGVSAYGASQTVHYSPADTSSHMSFDGFGTYWGW